MTASTPYNTTTANSGAQQTPYQDGTTLDNCVIGGVTPAAGTFTTCTVTNLVGAIVATPVICTAASLAITAALHSGRTIVQDRATGTAFTLPAATGSGAKYRIFIKTTMSGGSTTISTASLDVDVFGTSGFALFYTDDNAQTPGMYVSTATMNTITLNGTTTSGISGCVVELQDIAPALWSAFVTGSTTGDDISPFTDV